MPEQFDPSKTPPIKILSADEFVAKMNHAQHYTLWSSDDGGAYMLEIMEDGIPVTYAGPSASTMIIDDYRNFAAKLRRTVDYDRAVANFRSAQRRTTGLMIHNSPEIVPIPEPIPKDIQAKAVKAMQDLQWLIDHGGLNRASGLLSALKSVVEVEVEAYNAHVARTKASSARGHEETPKREYPEGWSRVGKDPDSPGVGE